VKYRTIFDPQAQAELRALPRRVAMTILRKLGELEQDPYAIGATALVGDPSVRRLRVGDYRVFYEVRGDELVVWVVHVAHRSTAYD
jgi:mRNA interferase RelE/StbE